MQPAYAQVEFYEAAVKEYKKHNYEQAAKLFNEYLVAKLPADKMAISPTKSEDPTISYAMFYEAVCLEQIGDTKDAAALYNIVVQRYQGTKLALEADKRLQKSKSAPTGSGKSQPPARDPSLDTFPKETWAPFKRFGNLMLVQGYINGKSTGMLFDTGAAGCLFSTEQLKSLGLEVPSGAPTASVAGVGVNKQTPAWTIYADIRLGSIQRRKFPVQVNTNPLNYPLLGVNFTEGLEYTIDNQAGVIQFKSTALNQTTAVSAPTQNTQTNPSSIGTPANSFSDKMFITVDSSSNYVYNIPFTETNKAIIVKGKIGGKECRMILDTGTDICLFTSAQLKTLGIVPKYTGNTIGCKGAAGYMKAPLCVFENAEFGPIHGPMVCLVSEDALPMPLLGQNFLKGWQLTVDHSSHLIKMIRK